MKIKLINQINKQALTAAERNIASGCWKLKTAQFFLTMVDRQPEDHAYLIKSIKGGKNETT